MGLPFLIFDQPVGMLPGQFGARVDHERRQPKPRGIAFVPNALGQMRESQRELGIAGSPVAPGGLVAIVQLHDLEGNGSADIIDSIEVCDKEVSRNGLEVVIPVRPLRRRRDGGYTCLHLPGYSVNIIGCGVGRGKIDKLNVAPFGMKFLAGFQQHAICRGGQGQSPAPALQLTWSTPNWSAVEAKPARMADLWSVSRPQPSPQNSPFLLPDRAGRGYRAFYR